MHRERHLNWATVLVLIAAGCFAVAATRGDDTAADEPEPDFSTELPRIPPVEPDKALATFQVQPGFRLEQVAAEPLVADPVAVSFDEDGRLYVVEMRGYSEQADEHLSEVRLLTDTDGDGRFDTHNVFVDQLAWPTAVICYDGGVFVADAPDILFCKDTDGDGRADTRKAVLTGFGNSNVQGLLNSFAWGLDNRIHGATSSSGGQVRRADDVANMPVALNGRDFSFDPRKFDIRPESGGAQHGMSFDDWGRKFVCSNSDHLQQVMFDDLYLARNPYLSSPSPRISIADDGPQAEVYRASPVEPWRIVRTRLRVAGAVPGPIEGGGRAAGYFTGATGATIYRGDAWPRQPFELAVVGDVGSNLVHRKRLEPNGLEFIARRIDEQSEFVASSDIWFRPCQFANAPDGTLYILDVYREVIEHPASLPPVIKRHLDLTSGRDLGRIYRIVPEGFEQRPMPRMSEATTAELVATLPHANAWHRETAARLLYQRQDLSAVPLLTALAAEGESPLGRMHALYALAGLGALLPEHVIRALADVHGEVRTHAVRLAERVVEESPDVRQRLFELNDDDELRVRYQLAFTLGELTEPARLTALAKIARRDVGDRWVRLAIQSSLATGAGEVFADLAADMALRSSDAGRDFLAALARQAGVANRPSDVAAVLKTCGENSLSDQALLGAIVRGLSEGLAQRGSPLGAVLATDSTGKAAEALAQLLASAKATAADREQPLAMRIDAIRALGLDAFAGVRDVLAGLLDNREPQEIQVAAMGALAAYRDSAVANLVLAAWPGLSPRLRVQASEALFARAERTVALLDAIEAGRVHVVDLDAARLKQLAVGGDAVVRERATKLLASLNLGLRQDVVNAYRNVLDLAGDPQRGKLAFKKVCAACHKVEGLGHEIGPNLATIKNRGAESLLVNMLDPSREVNPQFVNYVLVTDDGRMMTGLVASETATSVTLRRGEDAGDTVLRINIDELRSTGLSLMPDGVEKQLTREEMADLIAYLLALK
ncbi:MAG TPA: PVC-type heme-binding CxxCH protein [Pirellulales bacterium]|jgi:putative membrane-bound dehydrogenase-like protein|nr:PVC-type heme-binding CxxCH protein [Pirellulales bacterium]